MNNSEIIRNKILKLIDEGTLKISSYKAGDIIYREGEVCSSLGYILKGKINISTISEEESEETISVINEGGFFGHFLMFQDKKKYLGDINVSVSSKIVFISKTLLLNLLTNDKEFLEAYLSIITNESFLVKQQVKLLSHKKSIDRVIYYLKTNSINNHIEIKSITLLSKKVNLPRETVSRMISKLIKENKIKKKGYMYYIAI